MPSHIHYTASNVSSFLTNSATLVDLTGASVSHTTKGGVVCAMLIPENSAASGSISCTSLTLNDVNGSLSFQRDGAVKGIARFSWSNVALTGGPFAMHWGSTKIFWDKAVPPGTYTYKLQTNVGNTSMGVLYSRLDFIVFDWYLP